MIGCCRKSFFFENVCKLDSPTLLNRFFIYSNFNFHNSTDGYCENFTKMDLADNGFNGFFNKIWFDFCKNKRKISMLISELAALPVDQFKVIILAGHSGNTKKYIYKGHTLICSFWPRLLKVYITKNPPITRPKGPLHLKSSWQQRRRICIVANWLMLEFYIKWVMFKIVEKKIITKWVF